MNLEAGLLVMA